MCEDVEGFSTVVGRRRDVVRLTEAWEDLLSWRTRGLSEPPQHLDLTELGGPVGDRFHDEDSPAVAFIRHATGAGFRIAGELQGAVLAGNPTHGIEPLSSLLVEPGFQFRVASASTGPTVQLHPAKLGQVKASAPAVSSQDQAAGRRVALLDTGLARANQDMADFTGTKVRTVPSDDLHGHGTAMAEVIEAVNPRADIYAVRVLGQGRLGRSHEILVGFAFALWSEQFDLVSASVTTAAAGKCETSLGRSLDYLLAIARSNKAIQVPLVVAAAGNDASKSSAYPAVLLDTVVAVALQEDPPSSGTYVRARYNSKPPANARVEEAYGGDDKDSLGQVTPSGSNTAEPQWGSSYAAAAVAGAYLP